MITCVLCSDVVSVFYCVLVVVCMWSVSCLWDVVFVSACLLQNN